MNGYRSRSSPGRITMTANDLQRIEAALGRPLPAAVTRFFLNYPPELRSTVREIGGPDEDGEGDPYTECAADAELSDKPEHSDQLWESLEEFARGLIESYRSG
jgi:hypothetical protein